MPSSRLTLWLSPLLFVWACSASHAPDDCDEPGNFDFDTDTCVESVSGEPRDGGRKRDAGRDARVREPDDDATDDEADDASDDVTGEDDRPCRRGSTRKCQCSSGAYRDQMCTADRTWETCACGGPPPLVFGDASVSIDAGRRDAAVPDAGPQRAPQPPLVSLDGAVP